MKEKSLVDYYNEEIDYLFKEGDIFAKNFPSIAKKLNHLNNNQEDYSFQDEKDNIDKIIQSFAFLTGRLQRQTDNLFPEFSENLIAAIYPDILNDIPSMTLLHFEPDINSRQSIKFKNIPKKSRLYVENLNKKECIFSTIEDFNFLQLQIEKAKLVRGNSFKPYDFFIKLDINYFGEQHETPIETKFYTNGGKKFLLWDAIISSPNKEVYIEYDKEIIKSEIKYTSISNALYSEETQNINFLLLKNFFTLPDMFLNFSISIPKFQEKFSIYIPVNIELLNFEISEKDIKTNVVPVINEYEKHSEPFTTDMFSLKYPIISDSRKREYENVISVKNIIGINKNTSEQENISNYFHNNCSKDFYWLTNSNIHKEISTNLKYISFVSISGNISKLDNKVFFAEIVCSNMHEGEKINSSSSFQSDFTLPDTYIHSFGNVSEYKKPSKEGNQMLQLISYLSINYLSFASDNKEFEKKIQELINFFSVYFCNKNITDIIEEIKVNEKIKRSSNQMWVYGIRGISIDISFGFSNITQSNILTGFVISKLLCAYVNTGQFIEVNIYQKWNLLTTFTSTNGTELAI